MLDTFFLTGTLSMDTYQTITQLLNGVVLIELLLVHKDQMMALPQLSALEQFA